MEFRRVDQHQLTLWETRQQAVSLTDIDRAQFKFAALDAPARKDESR